jgi:hypothetical protein
MEFLTSIFKGPTGDGSAKRVIAFYLLLLFTYYIITAKTPDSSIVYSILGTITLLLGVSAVTKT